MPSETPLADLEGVGNIDNINDASRSATAGKQARRALALLLESAAPDRAHLTAGLFWLVLAAGLDMLGPILGKALIDDHLLPHVLDWPRMAVLLTGCLASGWIASVLRYLQLVRLSGLAMRSVRRLREAVYRHVMALPMAYFDQAITGQLVSRVTNDTDAVKNLYIQVLFVILDNGIVLTGAMLAMAWLDWRLMLIVLVLVPAVVVIIWFYQRWSAPAVARSRQLRSQINAQIAESIGGMPVLQASNATARFSQRFGVVNHAHRQARHAELRANAWLLRPALDLMNILLLIVVLYSFGQRPISGVAVGILYAFVSYIARVVDPLIQITLQFSQLQQAVVATSRVGQLLDEPLPARHETGRRMNAGAVEISHLTFGYAPQQPVLHDLNLRIPAGAFYGIVGHTGSGKTTLLSLLLRFYPAGQGSITIDGIPLEALDDTAFRTDVALVPQEPHLLAASIRDNIDMGRGLPQQVIEAAARDARIDTLIDRLPERYDTMLDEGGSQLSTGQKQLVAIARALAGQPRILFLDEATSRIDSATERLVQDALRALHGRVTVIAVAHRLSTIRDADAIIVLSHGHLAESGPHAALMAIENGIYRCLYLVSSAAEADLT
jgi:ATP-binding cassette subfamily B multidrug efflux pump